MPGPGTATLEPQAIQPGSAPSTAASPDRRRFTNSALIAVGIAAVPYLWVLWDGGLDPLRTAWRSRQFSNFYEIQARALFHGHWWVPKGSLGIEAFVIDGRDYTYFGPFPALLRMPIMAVTDALDGRLTAPSMLLAWAVTALFVSLLAWRVRLLVRGPVPLGRAEAASFAVVLATILSGSTLLHLAAMPWVYHEDLAWSVALTTGALFALLGVLEHPTKRRVIALGALISAATLARSATGWACVIGAMLAAAWFASGRGGDANRRWWRATLAAGLIPLAIGCALTWVKFGVPFGLPMNAQVFTKINQHRREFLAANGGRYFNPEFVPSTLLAYLRPDGLRFTSVFPFITLPAAPARAVGGVVLDQVYRTTSVPSSMPLLFLLSAWGAITAFRPRPVGRVRLTRVPLLAAGACITGVLVWGYIANRFLADFLPLLVLASLIGLCDVWRRLEGRSRRVRSTAVAIVAALAVFGMVANLAAASTPTERIAWEGARLRSFIKTQQSVGDLIGKPLKVERVDRLPPSAPADQLFVVGNCAGLYYSLGDFDHPWAAVERATTTGEFDFTLTVHRPLDARVTIPLVTAGDGPSTTVSMQLEGAGRIRFRENDRHLPSLGKWGHVKLGRRYQVMVNIDTGTHEVSASLGRFPVFLGWTSAPPPRVVVHTLPEPDDATFSLRELRRPPPKTPICRSLLRGTTD